MYVFLSSVWNFSSLYHGMRTSSLRGSGFGIQVLLTSCKVMAPFTPFFAEFIYQNLRRACEGSEQSVHFCSFPEEEGQVLVFHSQILFVLAVLCDEVGELFLIRYLFFLVSRLCECFGISLETCQLQQSENFSIMLSNVFHLASHYMSFLLHSNCIFFVSSTLNSVSSNDFAEFYLIITPSVLK